MFKKVLQSLSKSLNKPAAAPQSPAPASAPVAGSRNPAPAARGAPPAPVAPSKPKTVEDLLGIDAKMSKDQIRDRLKLLYRRYNRAASSLDNNTRAEADSMLDAIVTVREKHFGEI